MFLKTTFIFRNLEISICSSCLFFNFYLFHLSSYFLIDTLSIISFMFSNISFNIILIIVIKLIKVIRLLCLMCVLSFSLTTCCSLDEKKLLYWFIRYWHKGGIILPALFCRVELHCFFILVFVFVFVFIFMFLSFSFSHFENGKWKMENGKWKMENGKWKMENGKWKMENGKWKMENG
jgi:hypothetical protein